jgi:hypothetical protein
MRRSSFKNGEALDYRPLRASRQVLAGNDEFFRRKRLAGRKRFAGAQDSSTGWSF